MLYSNSKEFENEIGEDYYFNLISMDFMNISNIEMQEVIYKLNIDSIYFDQAIYICTKFKLNLISLKIYKKNIHDVISFQLDDVHFRFLFQRHIVVNQLTERKQFFFIRQTSGKQ